MDAVVRSLRFRAMRVLALSLRTESLDPGGRQGLWITFGAILNPLLRKPQANAAAAYFQLMLDAWNVSLSINLPANGIDLASNVLTDPQNPLLQSAILANLAAAAASVNPRGDLDSQPYRSTTNTPWLFRAFSGLKSRFGRSQPPSAVLYPSDANLAQLSIAALLCAFPAPVARRGITVVINPRQVLTPALGQVWMLPVNLGTHQIKHVSFNRHADLPLINIS